MPRILHTADWQIGRQFEMFGPEDGALLAEARFAAVERIAQLASERAVDAVLVAGDLFDAQWVSDRTIRRLFLALQGYSGPWLLLPGNHDAALAEGVWTRAQRLGVIGPNVQPLLEPKPWLLDASSDECTGIAVLPAPLSQRRVHEDLTAWFDTAPTPEGFLRIGLAHGSVQGVLPDDLDCSNPIAADRARRAHLDYLALGDWHGRLGIDDRTWYSGTPEPDRFRNNDAGCVLEVELPAPGSVPRITTHRIARHTWVSHQERIEVPSDLDRLIAALNRLPPQSVLELRCSGQVDFADYDRLQQALEHTAARLLTLRTDLSALRLVPTDADLADLHADGYLAEVVAELRAAQAKGGDEVSRTALLILADLLRAGPGTRP
ncbi:metallophosphoesterase family protein [Thermochromatium tepidum]|jgi:DNA repair exonuclease|uniref:DNA repair exonuclease n=1 Tax=Thermochromatium tepidum ATCC 43061 TaxID=316276 RepID=A0A6I6E2N8_THETI|nr:DNA repair exonuclease [Thermochromatium tepidum]QGU31982.1 DNA repair exonuclease [Thermochromatium tepidum ATCC 43061]